MIEDEGRGGRTSRRNKEGRIKIIEMIEKETE